MSIFDVMIAVNYAFSSLPVPTGWPGIPGAMGNQATCDAQGFFLMAGRLGSILYSCSLSIYFLCIVKYNMTYHDFRRKYESLLHIVSVVVSVATLGACVADGAINPLGMKCTLTSYPADCLTRDDIECIRGENAYAYYIIGYGIMGIAACVVCGIFISIALMVVRQEMRNRSYTIFGGTNSANEEGRGFEGITARMLRRLSGNNDRATQDNGPLATALRRRSTITGRASQRRAKEAKNQAFLYIFGFFITNIFIVAGGIHHQLGHYDSFVMLVLISVFSPLQGLTNVLVYTYPHVAALRRSNTDDSWWKAFRSTIISGGDHDEMERWRQIRRAGTIGTNNSVCQLCTKIKAPLRRRRKQQDSLSDVDDNNVREVGGSISCLQGDVRHDNIWCIEDVGEQHVENQEPEVEQQIQINLTS